MRLEAPPTRKCSNTTGREELACQQCCGLYVAMYLRFTQRANSDGTVVRYVALAHNRRVGGKVKPDVLLNWAGSTG